MNATQTCGMVQEKRGGREEREFRTKAVKSYALGQSQLLFKPQVCRRWKTECSMQRWKRVKGRIIGIAIGIRIGKGMLSDLQQLLAK